MSLDLSIIYAPVTDSYYVGNKDEATGFPIFPPRHYGRGERRRENIPHILRLTESSFIPVRPRPQREGNGLKLFKEED